MQRKRKPRRYRKALSAYFAESVLFTILISCMTAVILLMAVAIIVLPHLEALTPLMMCAFALFICCLTICLTGIILYIRTKKITTPIAHVSDAIMKISGGDFKVRVKNNKPINDSSPYENELDELIENLNKMATELEGMDYMRKDFMSNVSHEVKTPVAAITGFSEILLDGDLCEEDQKEYLTLINQESIRLSDLCEKMLQMSRLDHQEIVSVKDTFRLDEQLRKCMILLSEKWQAKNIEFIPELSEVTIVSNQNLVMQIWMNLIDNAIKYSDNHSKIYISLVNDSSSILVRIKDEGIGIPLDKLDKVYNRFYQCEESHKKQGVGLGLSIVKKILDLLHGTIAYESEPGKGTTVTVLLEEGIILEKKS